MESKKMIEIELKIEWQLLQNKLQSGDLSDENFETILQSLEEIESEISDLMDE